VAFFFCFGVESIGAILRIYISRCAVRVGQKTGLFSVRRLHSWLDSRLYSAMQCWDNWLAIWLQSWVGELGDSHRYVLLELAVPRCPALFFRYFTPGDSFRHSALRAASCAACRAVGCAVGCA